MVLRVLTPFPKSIAARLSVVAALSLMTATGVVIANLGYSVPNAMIAGAAIAAGLIVLAMIYFLYDAVSCIRAITAAVESLATNETPVRVPFTRDHDDIGALARAVAVFKTNPAAQPEKQQQLEKLNGCCEIALNNMSRGLSMFDSEQRLIVCNAAYRDLYDLPADVMRPGITLPEIASYWAERHPGAATAALGQWGEIRSRPDADGAPPFIEHHALGDGRVISVSCQRLPDGGWVDLHEDVTEERRADWRIKKLAHSDTLTGIANRHHFFETLKRAYRRAKPGASFGVLWLDLDRF
jgi:PAS domain-containing protein